MGWGALLAALLLQQTLVRAARPDGIDLTSYLLSAQALAHGASPYVLATPFPYLYPPTLAFLLIPLALAPPVAAVVLWFALNAGAAVWAIRRTVIAVDPCLAGQPNTLRMFLALFFTCFFPIVQSNLRNGQVNFLVLALCVAAAGAGGSGAVASPALPARPARPAHPAPPALLWSLAVAIKLVPLVLLPWFALRRTRAWTLMALLLCGAWLALPVVVVGARIIDIYRQFADVLMAAGFSPRSAPLDFSLAGAIAGLTGAPATAALRVSAAAIIFGWILQADARRLRRERVRPLALFLLGIPLASPKSEVHHLAFMLPGAAVTAVACWRAAWRSRTVLIAAAAAAALYVMAIARPQASGPVYCAALLAVGIAIVNVPERCD